MNAFLEYVDRAIENSTIEVMQTYTGDGHGDRACVRLTLEPLGGGAEEGPVLVTFGAAPRVILSAKRHHGYVFFYCGIDWDANQPHPVERLFQVEAGAEGRMRVDLLTRERVSDAAQAILAMVYHKRFAVSEIGGAWRQRLTDAVSQAIEAEASDTVSQGV